MSESFASHFEPFAVVMNIWSIILSPSRVILNEVKNLVVHAQDKLHEESCCVSMH